MSTCGKDAVSSSNVKWANVNLCILLYTTQLAQCLSKFLDTTRVFSKDSTTETPLRAAWEAPRERRLCKPNSCESKQSSEIIWRNCSRAREYDRGACRSLYPYPISGRDKIMTKMVDALRAQGITLTVSLDKS